MSTEQLDPRGSNIFLWNGEDSPEDYLLATYALRTMINGEVAAIGIAREQSLCADRIADTVLPDDLHRFRAKVVSVDTIATFPGVAQPYFLKTTVYGNNITAQEERCYQVVLAYPIALFGARLTRLWNSIFGEIHRLGFLTAVRLVDIRLPEAYASRFTGPRHGVAGLRTRLDLPHRPIFCRSMRPATGIDTSTMSRLNEAVLTGGFDAIKDDELTYDSARSPFEDRVRRMVDLKHRVEDESGEAKLYFANAIDDLPDALRCVERAADLGADGVLISPHTQGLSIIGEVARRTGLIILSHNSCGDILTRAPSWGVAQAVMAYLQRAAGADLVVTPGPFATPWQDPFEAQDFLQACSARTSTWASSMPIIQGGKNPGGLSDYITACSSTDFMIIAATWVDDHPEGIRAGARAFRQAWENIQAATMK